MSVYAGWNNTAGKDDAGVLSLFCALKKKPFGEKEVLPSLWCDKGKL